MSTVNVGLRVELDQAAAEGDSVIGIKLDQSKCFDRIVPEFAAILFLAFGMPQKVVNVFLKMYGSMRKHLSFRGWVSNIAVTSANGVAQGCSLSLIVINVYMAVWARFMSILPEVSFKAFIDDAYIWVRLRNIDLLHRAFEVTRQWNKLVGQKLNPDKCILWATTTPARTQAKCFFPDIPLALEVDVLGATMQTSGRSNFHCSEQKVEKIVNDVRNIAALPVSVSTKSQLIASKVIPQCSYAAELAALPKSALSRVQSSIATALWKNRPNWRSKMLIFSLLVQPCLVEPCTARAFSAIRNFWRFLHRNPHEKGRLTALFDHSMTNKHSYLFHVQSSLKIFHFALFPDMSVGIADIRFPVLEIDFCDLKQLLYVLGKQACYEHSCDKPRKDLFRPKGMLDPSLSVLFKKRYKIPVHPKDDLTPHFDSQSVGCTITNDRRFAAGFADSSECRFCAQTKECLSHIILECPNASPKLRASSSRELGVNFQLLGICEHPVEIVSHRLRCQTQIPPAAQISDLSSLTEFWTDGSVLMQECFWLTSAGFSVIDSSGSIVCSGPVHHVTLNSYTAELFAITQAVLFSKCRLRIRTDCQTVVTQFSDLVSQNAVDDHWSHKEWWQWLLHVWRQRVHHQTEPIQLRWMKAHAFDHIPEYKWTEQMLREAGLTRQQILCNQRADFVAKEEARKNAAIDPSLYPHLQNKVFEHQLQLAMLNKQIGDQCALKVVSQLKEEIGADGTDFINARFPSWNWKPCMDDFDWIPAPAAVQRDKKSRFGEEDFQTIVRFLLSLRWQKDDAVGVAFVELLCLFLGRGYTFQAFTDTGTSFNDALKHFKRSVVSILSQPGQSIIPGMYRSTEAYKCGRALPKGAIFGARPFISTTELEKFAHILMEGCSQNLATWSFPLSLCLA